MPESRCDERESAKERGERASCRRSYSGRETNGMRGAFTAQVVGAGDEREDRVEQPPRTWGTSSRREHQPIRCLGSEPQHSGVRSNVMRGSERGGDIANVAFDK